MYQVARGAKAQILPLSLEHALMTRTRPHHVGRGCVGWCWCGRGGGEERERERKCVWLCVCRSDVLPSAHSLAASAWKLMWIIH